jgi:hypothetical protein
MTGDWPGRPGDKQDEFAASAQLLMELKVASGIATPPVAIGPEERSIYGNSKVRARRVPAHNAPMDTAFEPIRTLFGSVDIFRRAQGGWLRYLGWANRECLSGPCLSRAGLSARQTILA